MTQKVVQGTQYALSTFDAGGRFAMLRGGTLHSLLVQQTRQDAGCIEKAKRHLRNYRDRQADFLLRQGAVHRASTLAVSTAPGLPQEAAQRAAAQTELDMSKQRRRKRNSADGGNGERISATFNGHPSTGACTRSTARSSMGAADLVRATDPTSPSAMSKLNPGQMSAGGDGLPPGVAAGGLVRRTAGSSEEQLLGGSAGGMLARGGGSRGNARRLGPMDRSDAHREETGAASLHSRAAIRHAQAKRRAFGATVPPPPRHMLEAASTIG